MGDLPANAAHHHAEPGGRYRHSVEVALMALEEFEGNMKMEQRPDGGVDSFRSSRRTSKHIAAAAITALAPQTKASSPADGNGSARATESATAEASPLIFLSGATSRLTERTAR